MPKPMIRTPQTQTQTTNLLSVTPAAKQDQKQTQKLDKMMIDKLLRKPRSKKYMEAIHKLDAGGHVHNQKQVEDIINTIKEEFPEVEISGMLLGIVSECYLGRPYEVHTVDISRTIINHYQSGHALPNGMEKARVLAMRGGYDCIEVYTDCCRAISSNGAVSVITG